MASAHPPGRREKTITIEADGRDFGKTFFLLEMPASQAEAWATRALLALANSGVEIPDEIGEAGMAGIAVLGLKAFGGLKWSDAKPLLDEMFACISAMPDPIAKPEYRRKLVENDTEEVATRLLLRGEVLAMHMGFSLADVLSRLRQAGEARAASLDTKISPE